MVRIRSVENTDSAGLGVESYMKEMVGNEFGVGQIKDDKVKVDGYWFHVDDVEVVGEIDQNLQIPFCSNHNSAQDNGDEEVLLERIGYVADYLAGLHNTDVFKKGNYQISRYDGSGHMYLEGTPAYFMAKTRLELLQRKKTGFVRDKPDVIIMMDNSSSVAGNKMPNHMRVLSSAISDVFFAELNKVRLITFGSVGKYFEFDDKNQFVDHMLNKTRFEEGSTRYDLAFQQAIANDSFKESTRPRLILLVTDGVPTCLADSAAQEIDKRRRSGEYNLDEPRTLTSKSQLLESIDMISSLSALSNTVFRIYVLTDSSDDDRTYARIAEEVSDRLNSTEKGFDDTCKILVRRFINEIMKNGMNISFEEFSNGKAFHNIVEDIKNEFYKLQALR